MKLINVNYAAHCSSSHHFVGGYGYVSRRGHPGHNRLQSEEGPRAGTGGCF